MSTRTNLRPQIVIPSPQGSPANGSSMAANITSAPTILQSLTRVSYAISWIGTSPVGTVAVQVSNTYAVNPDGSVLNAGTWDALPLESGGTVATTVAVSGNSGHGAIDIDGTGFYAIRLVYTAVSGTGTLLATINAKVS